MSTEYEKQLETRIAELEAQLTSALKPKLIDGSAVEPLSLSHDGWKLVSLFNKHPQLVKLGTNKRVIMCFKKKIKGMFKTKEYKLELDIGHNNTGDYYLGTKDRISNYHQIIADNVFFKCIAQEYIKICLDSAGEVTTCIYVTDKWDNK